MRNIQLLITAVMFLALAAGIGWILWMMFARG